MNDSNGLLPATVTQTSPCQVRVDGSATAINCNAGNMPVAVNDRVWVARAQSQLIIVASMSTSEELATQSWVTTQGYATQSWVNAQIAAAAPDLKWHRPGHYGEPAYLNGWANYTATMSMTVGGFGEVKFRKDECGIVWLDGLANGGTIGTNPSTSTIFTLPSGYQPDYTVIIANLSGIAGQVRVDTSGDVSAFYGTAGSWFGLSDVHFPAAGAVTWNTVVPSSPYSNLGAGWAPLRYAIDTSGDVHLSGLVTGGGTTTTGQVIATLPAVASPAWIVRANVAIAGAAGATIGRVRISTNGQIIMDGFSSGGNDTFISLDGITFPSATLVNDAIWGGVVFINSWTNYGGGYANAALSVNQVTKRVSARGLIKSGTVAAPIFTTFNPELQPRHGELHISADAGNFGAAIGTARIDVTYGNSMQVANYQNGGTNGYVHLDNIHWFPIGIGD